MRHTYLTCLLLLSLGLVSCKARFGTLSPEDFILSPQPLEENGGSIQFTLSGRFPDKFMPRKATLTVTPVLRYRDDSEYVTANENIHFQGEALQGNAQEISHRLGGSFTLRSLFAPYQPDMLQSNIYLTFQGRIGKKEIPLPDIKVGRGVLATATLLQDALATETFAYSQDCYQDAIAQQQQAQLNELIRQTKIRTSELQQISVPDYIRTLRDIKADQQACKANQTAMSADGSSEQTQPLHETPEQACSDSCTQSEKENLEYLGLQDSTTAVYAAEDWKGFRELLKQSNIQDKDIMLRALSLYAESADKEKHLRSISPDLNALMDEILPELRRSRLAIHCQAVGKSNAEILHLAKTDVANLSADELLYAATLTADKTERERLYVSAATLQPDDYRAYNNLAAMAYEHGDLELAQHYAEEAYEKAPNAAEVNANLALFAMATGQDSIDTLKETVRQYLTKATGAPNYLSVQGCHDILCGQYAHAAQKLRGVRSNAAALALLLNKDYLTAAEALAGTPRPDATTSYLKAIIAARTGEKEFIMPNLQTAIQYNPAYKRRAAIDLEFSKIASNPTFLNMLR